MRREGGWIRTYRAHHKADTITTTGHIVNAMREIDAEEGKNDWPWRSPSLAAQTPRRSTSKATLAKALPGI
jgi:hypothetical protein